MLTRLAACGFVVSCALAALHAGAARAQAPGCASPCSAGTLAATHPFYDVFVTCGDGSFTARTGARHSVSALGGGPQNVIYGGQFGGPGTSDVAWQFHDQALTFSDPAGGVACAFDPPDTPAEPNSVGLEQEWTVSPAPGITCTLREEVVAFGTTEADSGVRLTLGTTNWSSSASSVNVGVRWQIDYQNAGDDGPLFAPVVCDPPSVGREMSLEHELLPAEIRDFYRIQNNGGAPIFSNVTSTTSIAGIPDTGTPDRLIYGSWPAMVGSAWGYVATEGGCCPDSDSSVLWYHGYLPADGDALAPGASSRHSIVIFTSADSVDCGGFTPGCATAIANPPQDRTICAGDVATLDATGVTLTDCAGNVFYTWTDGVTTWSAPAVNVAPATTTRYDVAITCDTDPGCGASLSAIVTVAQPPVFDPPLAADPDPCNRGVKLTWNAAQWLDATGSGVYNVYRSTVSCADALAQPPLATGLVAQSWFDAATVGGTTHYVVEAEDGSPSPCVPPGPSNGGTVTRLCATAVTDVLDDPLPPGVFGVLRVRHVGDDLTIEWPLARALAPGEHFHLLKSWLDPRVPFARVTPGAWALTEWREIDTSARLQFFDLRVANSCEQQSLAEYPPRD